VATLGIASEDLGPDQHQDRQRKAKCFEHLGATLPENGSCGNGRFPPVPAATDPLRTLGRERYIDPMNGRLMLVLFAIFVAVGVAGPAASRVTHKAKEAARIERECSLKKGIITVTGDQIHFQPSPNEDYHHVDCALTRLNKAELGKLGFVGNEADPNAVLRPPLRYMAEGSNADISALARAAETEKWTIVRRATATDGAAILQFQSGAKMTNGEAMKLMDRIWKKEFGDLEFGTAPRKLSDRGDYDD